MTTVTLRLADRRTIERLNGCPVALEALRLALAALPAQPSAAEIAARLGMRPPSLSRLFAKKVGRSFKALLQLLRIEVAISELERGDCSIDHLAALSGYGSARTFSRSFRAVLGVAPSQFRRRLLAQDYGASGKSHNTISPKPLTPSVATS